MHETGEPLHGQLLLVILNEQYSLPQGVFSEAVFLYFMFNIPQKQAEFKNANQKQPTPFIYVRVEILFFPPI